MKSQPLRKFASILKIEPGEERLIGLLISMYFIIALGFVFVQSMAFGIFLAEYGVAGLPYSYIAIAIIASLVAALYIKIGGRVPLSKLLVINLIFLGGVSLLIWLALSSPLYHAAAFILPVWFQIVVNLGNLAVWPLAGRLFDFRQGKRLFPLLGSGTWLANIIGGLFILPLVNAIGATNLLFLAGLSFGAGLFVLRLITRAYLHGETPTANPAPPPARSSKAPAGIFKDRYILLIMAYTVLWWVAFFFVDNIFLNRAFAQYPDADQLAVYIGRLLSMMGIVALISSMFLSSRLIARFGLRIGLIAMPIAVTVIVGLIALGGSLGAAVFTIFVLSSLAKLINVAFGFSLSQSANAIVYQSLADTIRTRVQTIAEGIVQPIAVGLAGITLLALTAGLNFGYVGLSYVFIGLGIAWVMVIVVLSGRYIQALTRVITKRRLGDDANVLADPASTALLRDRLHDTHPAVAIYALNRLEALDEQAVIGELPGLVQHPAPEVRREALIRIEKNKLHPALTAVHNQLSIETDPSVREAALRAFGAIGDDLSPLTNALDETEVHSLRGALIGLLKTKNEPRASERLAELLASTSHADRVLAIQVMGEVHRPEYYPRLIDACDAPETSLAAGHALAAIGAAALPEIESAFNEPNAPHQRLFTLATVLGRIGGADAQALLASRISGPNDELRSQILHALSHSGYRLKEPLAIQPLLQMEVTQAAWISAAQVELGAAEETALLIAALQDPLVQIRNRVLLLLSFAFDGDSIRRVREALQTGSTAQASYALEIIDVQLPADWKPWVMPVLEDLSPQVRNQRLAETFPQPKQNLTERLRGLIENEDLPYWVRACAVDTAARLNMDGINGAQAMLSTVEKVMILKTVPMFSQTPNNVLADVADLLEEVELFEDETIIQKGDTGDSMYIILDGKVRVHDGGRLINYLGEAEIFGEMGLLDPEPRSASVTAVETTRLFRLDQGPFYDLIAERPEVALGIIHVLTARLRQRVPEDVPMNPYRQEIDN